MMKTETVEAIPVTAPAPPYKKGKPGSWVLLLSLVALIVGIALVWKNMGTHPAATAQTIPSVPVERIVRGDLSAEVPIPAEFRPYVEAELHAMVTGYVSQMNVDFGDKVTKGEVLATLQVPELQDQLNSAKAAQQQAEADYSNAHLIYGRLIEVNQKSPKLVAQQDIDTAQSKDSSAAAAVAAAKANVQRYQAVLDYTKITAPFDGVITKRSADPGDLVQAGTSSDRSMPIVRVSDNYHLRLDFPVSVEYVKDVHLGDPVTVRVDSLGGKTFTGKITRFADEVNDETRTMTTELQVDNPTLEIIPGMYAVADFKFASHANALAIPIEAVANPQSPEVYVVNANNQIESRQVKLGIETPDRYEVTFGLQEGDMVIVGNHTAFHPGQTVDPKLAEQPAAQ